MVVYHVKRLVYFHSVSVPKTQPDAQKLQLHNAGLIDFISSLAPLVDRLDIAAPRSTDLGQTSIEIHDNLAIAELSGIERAETGRWATISLLLSKGIRNKLKAADASISIGMSSFGFVSGLIAGRLGLDHAYIIRGDRATTVATSSRGKINKKAAQMRFRLYKSAIKRHVSRGTATVWFQGDSQHAIWLDELPSHTHERIHLLNAVLRPLPSPASKEAAVDLIFVGRLTIEKGLVELFEAIAAMPTVPSLTLIGDGPDKELLQRRCQALGLSDQVHFHGFVGDLQQMVDLISAARAFVLPSYTEGLPRSVLEAMHLRVPVVATTVGGLPQLLGPSDAGLLVDARDVDGLRAALERALNSDLSDMIESAHDLAQQHSFAAAATRFLEGLSLEYQYS